MEGVQLEVEGGGGGGGGTSLVFVARISRG